ncbi:MAG TPA: hypothetical protein VH105_02630 [Burkholderiales bacterium]|nr:hypothetical protein [Burkholderiales bacterium]
MKIPFDTSLSEQDAVFAMHIQAEQEVYACIAGLFEGTPEADAKMAVAQCRREVTCKTWLAFCLKKYSPPADAWQFVSLEYGGEIQYAG